MAFAGGGIMGERVAETAPMTSTHSCSHPTCPFPFLESTRALSAGERQKLDSSGGRKTIIIQGTHNGKLDGKDGT